MGGVMEIIHEIITLILYPFYKFSFVLGAIKVMYLQTKTSNRPINSKKAKGV